MFDLIDDIEVWFAFWRGREQRWWNLLRIGNLLLLFNSCLFLRLVYILNSVLLNQVNLGTPGHKRRVFYVDTWFWTAFLDVNFTVLLIFWIFCFGLLYVFLNNWKLWTLFFFFFLSFFLEFLLNYHKFFSVIWAHWWRYQRLWADRFTAKRIWNALFFFATLLLAAAETVRSLTRWRLWLIALFLQIVLRESFQLWSYIFIFFWWWVVGINRPFHQQFYFRIY
jgi:hypothetical protein